MKPKGWKNDPAWLAYDEARRHAYHQRWMERVILRARIDFETQMLEARVAYERDQLTKDLLNKPDWSAA